MTAPIFVAGATGYIGGRLAPRLLERGYQVRCLARNRAKLLGRPWAPDARVEVVDADATDEAQLTHAMQGCGAAYFLIHSMDTPTGADYRSRDLAIAQTFGRAAKAAGVARIVYLGGLGNSADDLSGHLASRREVEVALGEAGVPVTVLRAAMIIGSGSSSFAILRYLVERLPIMITPRWVRTEAQPISVRDVLSSLMQVLKTPETTGRVIEIRGPEIKDYEEMMQLLARLSGLRRRWGRRLVSWHSSTGHATFPRMPFFRTYLALLCLVALSVGRPARVTAQAADSEVPRVSIIYTGRSLGALGARRQQDEHELLTEQAHAEGVSFSLVSHAAWRVPGIMIFLPGAEPEGDELDWTIANRGTAERKERVPALRSENGLLLQDPWQPGPDLLEMLLRNPRQRLDFADLVPTTVTVSRLRQPGGNRVIIVEEAGAVWPTDARAFRLGVMNRVDLLGSRVFELPMNIGGLGPRATLMRRMAEETERRGGAVVRVDLGHQRGELNVPLETRARLDFTALAATGIRAVVPYEFELAVGAAGLAALRDSFPTVALVSANLRSATKGLIVPHLVVTLDGAQVGLIGATNPAVRERLPRARLGDFTIDPPIAAVQREVAALRERGVEAIVVLSNLDPAMNAQIASEIRGVDAILADMPVRWAPEVMRTRVELPERPNVRPGTPAFVARSVANGLAVGKLDLEFRAVGPERFALAAVEHRHERVNDRIPSDTALMARLLGMAAVSRTERGEVLVPSFTDLLDRHQDIGGEREEARGRITKPLWEEFMARVLRVRGGAEVAVLPRLDQFPPLIGKLHEDEIQEWVASEERVVVLDLTGGDLKALLRADARGELVTNGIDLSANTILGHPIRDNVLYRVTTTDVLTDGARAGFFTRARRPRRVFAVDSTGSYLPVEVGTEVTVRELLLTELRRIRRVSKGDAQIDSVAAWMRPDPGFVPLTTIAFERPTLSLLVNDVAGNEGYGTVPESRIRSNDAWVIALGGRVVLSRFLPTSQTDYGLTVAYGRQTVTADGSSDVSETADDIRLDATYRPTLAGAGWMGRFFPFARGEIDTEFSPTENRVTQERNPRQQAVRGLGGVLMPATGRWPRREASLAIENDFGQPNVQVGVQSRVEYVRPVGKAPPPGSAPMTYRLRNDLTYLLPARRDNATQLALRYNQIHDLVIPLANELSLSVTADLFVFQGKVKATRGIGTNSQLRVGLTYDRIWKPRYQPFF